MKTISSRTTILPRIFLGALLTGCATSFNEAKTSAVANQVVAADEAYSQCMNEVLSTGSYSKVAKKFILTSTYDYTSISKSMSINPTKAEIQALMDWFSSTQKCTAMGLDQYGKIDPELALNISRIDKERLISYRGLLKNKTTIQFNNEQRNFFNNRMLAVRTWASNLDNRTAELNSNYEWSLTQENYNFVKSGVGKISRYQANVFLNEIDQLQEEQGRLSVSQVDYANMNPGYRIVRIMNTSCNYNKNNVFECRQIYF